MSVEKSSSSTPLLRGVLRELRQLVRANGESIQRLTVFGEAVDQLTDGDCWYIGRLDRKRLSATTKTAVARLRENAVGIQKQIESLDTPSKAA